MILIEIIDNGPGMNAEQRARIFEPFSRPRPVALDLAWRLSAELWSLTAAQPPWGAPQTGGPDHSAIYRSTHRRGTPLTD